MTTVAEALNQANLDSDSATLDAELLLAHTLKKPRSWLRGFADEPLTNDAAARFEALCEQRRKGLPIAHLLGEREFWSLPITVTTDTLIPRPETELLVELALEKTSSTATVADLGTGSGAIALAIATERPDATVFATDQSGSALATANGNARKLELENLRFFQGNWCDALQPRPHDVIVSNPPYIDATDPHLQQGDVRFEPTSALVAGENGLADLRTIATQARDYLIPEGWLLLEHGWEQGPEANQLLTQLGYDAVSTRQDLAGNDRVTMGQFKGTA